MGRASRRPVQRRRLACRASSRAIARSRSRRRSVKVRARACPPSSRACDYGSPASFLRFAQKHDMFRILGVDRQKRTGTSGLSTSPSWGPFIEILHIQFAVFVRQASTRHSNLTTRLDAIRTSRVRPPGSYGPPVQPAVRQKVDNGEGASGVLSLPLASPSS